MTADKQNLSTIIVHPPMKIAMKDYAWGLAVLDVILQAGGDKMQVGVMFRNSSDGPIRYIMEKYELKLEGCIKVVAKDEPFQSCVVARDCNNLHYSPMMSRISPTPTPQILGTLDFTATYGHPDWHAVRRMHMVFNLVIISTRPPQPFQIMPSIKSHTEEDIKASVH